MTEPKDGPWRGNPHYLHNKLRQQVNKNDSLNQLNSESGLVFPQHLDWKNPGKDQQAWMDRILTHSPEAYFDIFQEYGLGRKDGQVTRYSDYDAEKKIGLATAMSGTGDRANYSNLYPIFGQEFADYFNKLGNTWHMFLYAKEHKGVPKVFGGGKMHVCDMGRTYWNGLSISFDDISEARNFLDTVKEHPRPGLELYLRTLFGDTFPRTHYDGRELGGHDRVVFYPFDEAHGPLKISTRDLTLTSEAK